MAAGGLRHRVLVADRPQKSKCGYMAIALFRRKLEGLLQGAEILIDGDRPWDIHVQNPKLYARIWEHGTLGAGEAYMEGWWDCDQLDEMIARTLRAGMQKQLKPVSLSSNGGEGACQQSAKGPTRIRGRTQTL